MNFDFTSAKVRPSARQIVSRWKRHGCPPNFTVEYGETFAEFQLFNGRWTDSGNGCAGVKRDEVVKLLQQETI